LTVPEDFHSFYFLFLFHLFYFYLYSFIFFGCKGSHEGVHGSFNVPK
jgi:hypothetical protein